MINYNKKERRGLPGGPNEQFSYVTGFFTQSNPFRSMIQYQDGSEVLNAPLRTGKRQNNDGSYSTHLMAREYIPERGWVVFPTLFQNEDGSWLELSTKNGWYDAYQEAIKRNEVIDFGEDEKAAINYADKGKWKKNYKIAEPSDNIKTKRLKGYQDGAETYDYSKNLDFETMQQYVQEVGMPYAWRQFNDAEKAMYRKVMSQFNYPDQPVDVYDPRGVNAEYYQGSDGQTYMQNLPAASIKDIPLAAGKYIKEFDDRYPKPKGSNLVEDWENKRNEYVVQGILKDNPELTERDVEYINSLTPTEQKFLSTDRRFQQSYYQDMLDGLGVVGGAYSNYGQNIPIPGVSTFPSYTEGDPINKPKRIDEIRIPQIQNDPNKTDYEKQQLANMYEQAPGAAAFGEILAGTEAPVQMLYGLGKAAYDPNLTMDQVLEGKKDYDLTLGEELAMDAAYETAMFFGTAGLGNLAKGVGKGVGKRGIIKALEDVDGDRAKELVKKRDISTLTDEYIKAGDDFANYAKIKRKELTTPEGQRRLKNMFKEYLKTRHSDWTDVEIEDLSDMLTSKAVLEFDHYKNENRGLATFLEMGEMLGKNISPLEKRAIEYYNNAARKYDNPEISSINDEFPESIKNLVDKKSKIFDDFMDNYEKNRALGDPPVYTTDEYKKLNKEYIELHENLANYNREPGGFLIGPGMNKKPIYAHEVQHSFQVDGPLPVDISLKNLKTKKEFELDIDDYVNLDYFLKGSGGREKSAFLAELREQALQDGFIKDRYENITPEQVKEWYEYYKKNPTGVNLKSKIYNQKTTHHRIFDIMEPVDENFELLSKELNKLVYNDNSQNDPTIQYVKRGGERRLKKYQQGQETPSQNSPWISESDPQYAKLYYQNKVASPWYTTDDQGNEQLTLIPRDLAMPQNIEVTEAAPYWFTYKKQLEKELDPGLVNRTDIINRKVAEKIKERYGIDDRDSESSINIINNLTDKEREILMTLPEFKNISKKNFSDTYSEARKAGQKEFTWMGKKFNTERANKNPYQTSTFETSIIPYTYLSARFGLLGNRDNMVREKRKINLDEGKLYFSRIGEATDGKVIIGGDYVEEEPTSYPAYMFKNNITERYTKLGEKIKLDNDTQLYYGIVNNKFKTGLINEFNDDDIVVPIRYGGKYDKRDAVQIDPEFINIMEPIYKLGPLTVDTNSEDFKNFVKNTKRPFLDSIGRQIGDYVQYKKNKLFKDSGLEGNLEEALDKYKTITGNTFVRNGVPIYNSGADGKLILHSPSKNKQLFLYKYTLDEIQDISQKFLEEYPDAEFISMDTGRYNFLVENPEGLSVDDFITYYENDLKRDKKIGYNIVYDDMNYKYKDGIRKKRYYSDKELLNLDVNKKNFNTLSLQKELFNRGYSLPNSIKEDGSFDGIFGDEVKEALLDWQSKNNKKRGGERRLQRGGMSKDGYKRYSPDVNNDYNIIPSGNITMKDVDFPVMGIDNFGNKQMMYPGYDYVYPGNTVLEIPMLKKR